jgi:hypothetical protein
MPAATPHILAIGATPAPEILRADGLTIRHAATLLDGHRQAVRRLNPELPIRPTVILLDLQATEPGFPELAAPQLVAVLAHAMHAGTLHPAWLIGLAPAGTPELDEEARVAGCHYLLRPPLDETALALLGDEHLPIASLPATDAATRAYGRAAVRVLAAVAAAQIPIWTADDARLLLHTLTPYPLRQSTERSTAARSSDLVRALGGPRAARARLETIAAVWQTRFPLHAVILRLLLDGLERREIVAAIVDRRLYEDSRVYAGINELPQRLAQELRTRQADEEDDV